MNSTLDLDNQVFTLEAPWEVPNGLRTPPVLRHSSPTPVSLRNLGKNRSRIEAILNELETNALWCLSEGGFDQDQCSEPISVNRYPNLNTGIHAHLKSPLDISFTQRTDCDRKPLEFFTNERVWSFIEENWTDIKTLFQSPLQISCFYHDFDGHFDQIFRRSTMIRDPFRQAKDFTDLHSKWWPDEHNKDILVSMFFSILPFIDSSLGEDLCRKAAALEANYSIPWHLAQMPSGAIFRGFHRGGIQEEYPEEDDQRAVIYFTNLR